MSIDEAIGLTGNAAVLVGFPAYIGVADRTVGVFALYCVLCGVILAIVDNLTVEQEWDEGADQLAKRAAFRTGGVVLVGGLIYFLTILAI
jgi:hypothetical protein